jgi:hypothetical protein
VSFLSKQLGDYTIMGDAKIGSDTVGFTLQRDMKESEGEKWGYSCGTSFGGETMSLSPSLIYKLN